MSSGGYIRTNESEQRENQEILAESDEIGDSVHPETKESYRKLGLSVPDSAYFAARRPFERTIKRVKEIKGATPDEEIKIINIYRIKDRKRQEWLCYLFQTIIRDLQDNKIVTDYSMGIHPRAYGSTKRDLNFNVVSQELDGIEVVYDIPFKTAELDRIISKHSGDPSTIELMVATESYNVNSFYGGTPYTIKNLDDFKKGKFEDLILLGQRGLSTLEPSLEKLKQPVEQDPGYSLAKQQKVR